MFCSDVVTLKSCEVIRDMFVLNLRTSYLTAPIAKQRLAIISLYRAHTHRISAK